MRTTALVLLLAAVAEGAEIVEGFSAGADRWEILDPETWRLAGEGDARRLEITARDSAYKPPHRSPKHIALLRDFEAEDVRVTFRVRSLLDTGSHRDCCVFFGWQDAARFYYVHLGARPDPHSGQVMLVDRADRRALTDNKRPAAWTDQWHTVRVERSAATGWIAVYFDNLQTPLMEVTDTTFSAGRIGIGSFDDMCAFDDVRVETLGD